MSSTDVARAEATVPDLATALTLLQTHVGTMEAAIGRALAQPWGMAAATLSDAMLAFLRDELGGDLGWVYLGDAATTPHIVRHTLGHTLAGRTPAAINPLLAALQGTVATAALTAPRWLYDDATGAGDTALTTVARDLGLRGILGVPLSAMAGGGRISAA